MNPFVTQEVRKTIAEFGNGKADAVGDLCYIVYVEIMRRWNESPRWTTIHKIRKDLVKNQKDSQFLKDLIETLGNEAKLQRVGWFIPDQSTIKFDADDVYVASDLAFDVFFHLHGMEYERKKIEENGNIL